MKRYTEIKLINMIQKGKNGALSILIKRATIERKVAIKGVWSTNGLRFFSIQGISNVNTQSTAKKAYSTKEKVIAISSRPKRQTTKHTGERILKAIKLLYTGDSLRV